jgi:hypothetical protein
MAYKSHTKYWLILPLSLLLWLITTTGQGLYTWILEAHSDSLSSTIPYKQLFQISLLILLGLIAFAFYHIKKVRSLTSKSVPISGGTAKPIIPNEETNKKRLKLLQNLSKDEKEYLKKYIDDKTATRKSHFDNGVPSGLQTKGILFCPNPLMYYNMITYNISDWAKEILIQKPSLLK